MEVRQPKGNRVRDGVTDAQLKKLHEDTAREFPRSGIGRSRKVDPEEAIDTTSRRGRLEQDTEPFHSYNAKPSSDEGKIDTMAKSSRYSADTKTIIDGIRRGEGKRKK